MVAPCKDCPNRSLYCHCDCEEYKEFLRIRELLKKKIEHDRYISIVKFGRNGYNYRKKINLLIFPCREIGCHRK